MTQAFADKRLAVARFAQQQKGAAQVGALGMPSGTGDFEGNWELGKWAGRGT